MVTPYDVIYDGKHTAATSITGVTVKAGPPSASSNGTTHTDAGTYTGDTWSRGTANYNAIVSSSITDTINQAPLTVTANPQSKAYGQR